MPNKIALARKAIRRRYPDGANLTMNGMMKFFDEVLYLGIEIGFDEAGGPNDSIKDADPDVLAVFNALNSGRSGRTDPELMEAVKRITGYDDDLEE